MASLINIWKFSPGKEGLRLIMCGIAGRFSPSGKLAETALEEISGVTNLMFHRGPDEGGLLNKIPKAVLGHRRLSIIDLAGGQQPMAYAPKGLWIVYNGEIYNYREIHSKLRKKGYVFRTDCDTEVVLCAYAEWGKKCVNELEGMFAFAIYDERRNRLFAARDHIGKKPFYYRWKNGILDFASEFYALSFLSGLNLELDETALALYLNVGFIQAPYTIYKEVRKLCPGESLTVDNTGFSLEKYWTPEISEHEYPADDEELLQELERLIRQQAEARLMSEVPLGAFLSGGIDSSLVVGMLSKKIQGLKTITVGFEGEQDEVGTAWEISKRYHAEHIQQKVSPDFLSLMEKMVFHFGEPFSDSSCFPTWEVCRAARQYVTVALSGDGGDEPFGGYDFRYLPHVRDVRLRKMMPVFIREKLLGTAAGLNFPARIFPGWMRWSNLMHNLSVDESRGYFNDLCISSPQVIRALTPDLARAHNEASDIISGVYDQGKCGDPLQSIMLADAKLYMTEDVLVKVDRMSMAHSLEVRSPLLSKRVVEKAFTIPANRKITSSQSKILLRKLLKPYLPSDITRLPKRGFHIPLNRWLMNEWKQPFEETVFCKGNREIFKTGVLQKFWTQHQKGQRKHGPLLWNVFFLSLWFQVMKRPVQVPIHRLKRYS